MSDPKSPMEHAADDALRVLSEAPPLALVAVGAALIELILARAAWQGLPGRVDLETLRWLRDLARFPRNLAAVSGTVALVLAIFAFLRAPGWAPIARRLAVAAFAGIFVPGVVVAAAFPYASLRPRLVIFGLAAANVLATLLAMTAVRNRPHVALRIATGMMATTTFLSLLLSGLGLIVTGDAGGPLEWVGGVLAAHPTTTQRVLLGTRHAGEVAWMAVLVGCSFTVLWQGAERRRERLAVGAATAAVAAAAVLASSAFMGHRFRLMLFGTFRFGLLLDAAPTLYAVPIGVGLGAGLVGLARRDPPVRQLAGGTLLWLAAGYSPHTPIQLLYLVLAAALVTRSAQALDPDGGWRRRNPWIRLATRAKRGAA